MAEVSSWDVALERGLIDLRAQFHDVQAELITLLAELEPGKWAASTVLPGWDVHSVALHLWGGDAGRLSRGVGRPAGHSELGFAELSARIEQSNEKWVEATRRIPPDLLVDMLRLSWRRLTALYADVDLWTPATPVAWAGAGPSPLWLDIGREYTERWVHQAQIREAVGAPLLDDRPWLWPVLDLFMLSLPRALAEVEAPAGTAVVIDVTGPASGLWHVLSGEDRWHVAAGPTSNPAASISLPADVAWRWLAGLIPRSSLEAATSTEGDPALWRPALAAVAVMTTAS